MTARARRTGVVSLATPVAGLAVLWCALWQQLTVLSVVTGILVGVLVRGVFYLPPVHYGGRVRPAALARLTGGFFVDVVRASFQVAWLAIRPRATPASAVLAVALRARSDVVILTTAELVTLVPGSVVVEIDRDHSVLYVHAIDVADESDARRVIEDTRDVEARVIRAIGSDRDRRRLDADLAREAS